MPTAVSDTALRTSDPSDGWWYTGWISARVVAGITDRHGDRERFLRKLPQPHAIIEAEQVHGASLAVVEHPVMLSQPLAGCDALVTSVPGVALLMRTADCVPIGFADPARGIVALAHVGWRGVAASLPARVIAALRHMYQSQAAEVRVVIGPSIRSCCYEVGPEFRAWCGAFLQDRGERQTCDLVGAAVDQLQRCGVRPAHVLDSRECTACNTQRWFSVRREGDATGRMTSLIMLRP